MRQAGAFGTNQELHKLKVVQTSEAQGRVGDNSDRGGGHNNPGGKTGTGETHYSRTVVDISLTKEMAKITELTPLMT